MKEVVKVNERKGALMNEVSVYRSIDKGRGEKSRKKNSSAASEEQYGWRRVNQIQKIKSNFSYEWGWLCLQASKLAHLLLPLPLHHQNGLQGCGWAVRACTLLLINKLVCFLSIRCLSFEVYFFSMCGSEHASSIDRSNSLCLSCFWCENAI